MQQQNFPPFTLACAEGEPVALAPEYFTPEYWQAQNAVTGSSKGRYTTWFVRHPEASEDWVLRHYWRGGMMEKFSKDKYFYTGLANTRAFAELALLEKLHHEGLPVPRPVGARVQRFALWYSADILIERMPGCRDLLAWLEQGPMNEDDWKALGTCIGRFHRRGVYHADLNAKNILKGPDGFALIDFDRGEIRTPAQSWQQANLSRLRRSFDKEKGKLPSLAFDDTCWQWLLAGYAAA
ncbi:3-deoxy-D-manno-octulosonic acid kinase [Shewanella jiangmenensis]|nr:3-deoxy-D-manno-octulosonic acid kinase [Shewanella jiangmenensis]